ncbi:dihydrofolate reductase family protein [Streptosporangium roseum]|uniref:dihydrofolate reductase family protein n=1 Tax=Streptosporangium roseum TaxID=2001 RepID=UPI00332AF678
MRKLTLWMNTSLDGYTEGPGGEFDWPVMEQEVQELVLQLAQQFDGILFGRKVFELLNSYWPTADTQPDAGTYERVYAPHYRQTPKYVFSRTLETADATVLSGIDQVEALKQQPGKGLVCMGGAEIADQLVAAGLVDEYRLFVHPAVLGGGRPLFRTPHAGLTLVESRAFDSAVVHLHYRIHRQG